MQRTGRLDLPLHSGKAPAWLFERMVVLAKYIAEAILIEFGRDYFLKQLAQPLWFQSLGCVLGFDWHSSGLTTTTTAAMKEAFKDLKEYRVFFCGGKGRSARQTPEEIREISENLGKDFGGLIYASRIAAKIDNHALQDGFNLYHHSFIFSSEGKWTVIQQGMARGGRWARRYHWHSEGLSSFVKNPHSGLSSDRFFLTLNLVDENLEDTQGLMVELSHRKPERNLKDCSLLQKGIRRLPQRHRILLEDIHPHFLEKTFLKTYAKKPLDFEGLLSLEGVGEKTLRALALIAELIYGAPLSFRDPARYSFAHGGKDGHPYRINLSDYEKTITVMERAVKRAKLEGQEKIKALQRLYRFYNVM